MKINQTTSHEAVRVSVDRSVLVKTSKSGSDSTNFTRASALEKALKEQSDIRPEKLRDAISKTSSLKYPPEELIQGISRLIADRIVESQER